MKTKGNSWTVTTSVQIQKQEVKGETQYRGKTAIHWHITDNNGLVVDTYGNDSNGVGYTYGGVTVAPGASETYYDPALAVPHSLPLNQPYTFNFSTHFIAINVPEIKHDITQTITYNGRETVTTAFGTFETCKFTHSTDRSTQPWHSWLVASGKLRGLQVQWTTNGEVIQPKNITVSW